MRPELWSVVTLTLGGVIAIASPAVRDLLAKKRELERMQLQWRKEYHERNLAKPIIGFLDECLEFVDGIYWAHEDVYPHSPFGEKRETGERVISQFVQLRRKRNVTHARVAALGDDKLTERFDEFWHKWEFFIDQLENRKLDAARNEMNELCEIGGDILKRLWHLEGLLETPESQGDTSKRPWWRRLLRRS